MARLFRTLDDIQSGGRRVLLRTDLNVPMQNGTIGDKTRLQRTAPTICEIADAGGTVIVLSHFGRPKGRVVPDLSLMPVSAALADVLGRPVTFAPETVGDFARRAVDATRPGDIIVLENLRFDAREEANDRGFAEALANLGEVFVNDAFSAAHRAHASTEAITHLLPSVAGRLMQQEIEALAGALENPARPVAALVGGAKVSTKMAVLGNLVPKADRIIIGGGMANTFLFAQGIYVGASLCETDLVDDARAILARAEEAGCEIVLPVDAVVARTFAADVGSTTVPTGEVPPDMMMLDVGPDSIALVNQRLGECRTLVWNGPMGAFEIEPFDAGTNAIAREVARLTTAGRLLSVAGGGDTVAALANAGVRNRFSYVSTAGGAFLEWLEGRTLPGIAALKRS